MNYHNKYPWVDIHYKQPELGEIVDVIFDENIILDKDNTTLGFTWNTKAYEYVGNNTFRKENDNNQINFLKDGVKYWRRIKENVE